MEKNNPNLNLLMESIPDKAAKPFLIDLIDALPNILILLDKNRKLIYSNQALLKSLELTSINEVFELRPGEIFKCVNVEHGEDGCGSAPECQLCGAYNALISSMDSGTSVCNDCRILSKESNKSTSFNLRFTSIPFKTEGSSFYVITIEDLSAETRNKELEKIFYHDVINSMAGIHGVLRLMKRDANTDPQILSILDVASKNLSEIIMEQRDFSLAEEGEFIPSYSDIRSLQILNNIELSYRESKAFEGKIVVAEDAIDIEFVSDPVLVNRILTNMTKNALEACKEGDLVTLNVQLNDQKLSFSVHNPAFIPKEIQYQIFERSYTTKGSGRGLGTYSMKLLGENSLGGEVNFVSTEESGTTFMFHLPFEG